MKTSVSCYIHLCVELCITTCSCFSGALHSDRAETSRLAVFNCESQLGLVSGVSSHPVASRGRGVGGYLKVSFDC